jgi:hypothetical protein
MNLPDISKIVHVGILQTMVIDRDAEIAELREALRGMVAMVTNGRDVCGSLRCPSPSVDGPHVKHSMDLLAKHEAAHG